MSKWIKSAGKLSSFNSIDTIHSDLCTHKASSAIMKQYRETLGGPYGRLLVLSSAPGADASFESLGVPSDCVTN